MRMICLLRWRRLGSLILGESSEFGLSISCKGNIGVFGLYCAVNI
jgi:hypothetical protein